MYDKSELESKLLNELRDIAKQFDIRKSETMKKQDLVYQILDHQAANPTPDILEAEKKSRVFPQKGARQRIPIDKAKEIKKAVFEPKQDPKVDIAALEDTKILAVPVKEKPVVAEPVIELPKPAAITEPVKRIVTPYQSGRDYNRDKNDDDDTPSVKSFERPESTNVPAWELQEFHERRKRGRRPQDRG
jgi:transcription termination factor Rho